MTECTPGQEKYSEMSVN